MELKQRIKKILVESINGSTDLYHGTNDLHDFYNIGDLFNGTFFSTNINEAESYGKHVYKIKIHDNINIFDSGNIEDIKILFNNFEELYDTYFDVDKEEHYIKTPEQLLDHADSWDSIEHTDGVMSWMISNYDGLTIYEGGIENILLFHPVKEKIKTFIVIK